MADPPVRLMNFISESQLEEVGASRGAKDGAVPIDKPLYEILKENKDKQETEFNERFKHRPPKALDSEETEFLDNLEMLRKEHERCRALEESKELANFHATIASRIISVGDVKAPISQHYKHQNSSGKLKRPSQSTILAKFIKVKPQPKKLKEEHESRVITQNDKWESLNQESSEGTCHHQWKALGRSKEVDGGPMGLVSYSDESEEDDI